MVLGCCIHAASVGKIDTILLCAYGEAVAVLRHGW